MLENRIKQLEKDFQPPEPCAVVILRPGETTDEAVARHIDEFGPQTDRIVIID